MTRAGFKVCIANKCRALWRCPGNPSPSWGVMLPRPKGRWALGRRAGLGSWALGLDLESDNPVLCLRLPPWHQACLPCKGSAESKKGTGHSQRCPLWSANFPILCTGPLGGQDLIWHVIRGEGDKIEEWRKNKEANKEILSTWVRAKSHRSQAPSLPPVPTWMVKQQE